MAISLRYLKELPKTLEVLCQEAAEEGFRFMDKLAKEWKKGRNRFDAPGEILLGAFLNNELVAVDGLNIDPYANDVGMARLRHLYVLKQARRQGVAAALVRRLLEGARKAMNVARPEGHPNICLVLAKADGRNAMLVPILEDSAEAIGHQEYLFGLGKPGFTAHLLPCVGRFREVGQPHMSLHRCEFFVGQCGPYASVC